MSWVPISPTNALLKASIVGRSPRQWSGSSIPRSVWVVIGPFWGSKPACEAQRLGLHSTGWPPSGTMKRTLSPKVPYWTKLPAGLPRSQASPSLSPEMWHEEQAASPWPELEIPS